jgi:poly(3-hydroxyalkanoate) synthetase
VTNTLVLTTDYTISGVGVSSGGNVTLVTGAAVDDIITVIGATALTRTTDFSDAGDFLASDLNSQLDNQIKNLCKRMKLKLSRAVLLADEDTSSNSDTSNRCQ